MALTNNVRFSSSTDKRYSYSDTCKNKPSVFLAVPLIEADFFPLSVPVHAHQCKHSSSSNNCNRDLCETHGSNYVSSTSKSVSTKTVCKLVRMVSCNKPAIFSPVYMSLHASCNSISKTAHCSVSCKPVSAFISGEIVKPFVTCKPVCFKNVSMAKKFNSANYCLDT